MTQRRIVTIASAVIVLLCAISAVVYLEGRDEGKIAVVYGKAVFEDDISIGVERLQAFVSIVQSALTNDLIGRFDIDTGDEAITGFANSLGRDLVSEETIRSDQAITARIADAAQEVIDGTTTAEEAHAKYDLEAFVTLDSWYKYLEVNGTPEAIRTLRKFASQPIPEARSDSIAEFRHIYFSREIERHICAQSQIETKISETIKEKLGDDTDVQSDGIRSVWNYECRLQANRFIQKELAENVHTVDPGLSGFSDQISITRLGQPSIN